MKSLLTFLVLRVAVCGGSPACSVIAKQDQILLVSNPWFEQANIGELCPLNGHGTLHLDMCKQCGKRHDPCNHRFTACHGCCNASQETVPRRSHSCVDIQQYYKQFNTLNISLAKKTRGSAEPIKVKAPAAQSGVLHDRCNVPLATERLERVPAKLHFDCTSTPCSKGDQELLQCCAACNRFARSKQLDPFPHIEPFVACIGCQAEVAKGKYDALSPDAAERNMFRWIDDYVCSHFSNASTDTCGDQAAKQSTFAPAQCPTSSAVSLPGSMPSAWLQGNLEIITTVSGLNFDKLHRTMKSEMNDKFANVFVSAFGVATDQVAVELTKGSVLVSAAIRLNVGQNLDPAKVPTAGEVVTAVLSVSGIGSAKEDGTEIAATNPLVRRHEARTATTTTMTITATSTAKPAKELEEWALLVAILAGAVGIVVMTCIWTRFRGCPKGQRHPPRNSTPLAPPLPTSPPGQGSDDKSSALFIVVEPPLAPLMIDVVLVGKPADDDGAGNPTPMTLFDPTSLSGRGSDDTSSTVDQNCRPFMPPSLPPVMRCTVCL